MTSPVFAETLPQSDDRIIVQNDLLGLDKETLRLARNEIFARKGYIFNSRNLRIHFLQYSWYKPRTKKVSLTKIEQHNVAFIKTYEENQSLLMQLQYADNTSPTPKTVVVIQDNPAERQNLEKQVTILEAEIMSLQQILKVQKNTFRDLQNKSYSESFQKAVLDELGKLSSIKEIQVNRFRQEHQNLYSTPIRPANRNLGATLVERSKSFPKVPYYIAGTNETGEMWLEPKITKTGDLIFNLNFVDPKSEYQQIIDTIELDLNNIETLNDGLQKVYKWSKQALEKNIRRRYEKMAVCTNLSHCENKTDDQYSTQIDFLIYEDGSTASKIIQNKGRYSKGFNYSIESTLLLSSYFNYLIHEATEEVKVGSQTEKDLDKLFD